jgi:hypothetical protein
MGQTHNMHGIRNVYEVLVEKPDGYGPFGACRATKGENLNEYFRNMIILYAGSRPEFDSWHGQDIFFYSSASWLVLGPTKTSI